MTDIASASDPFTEWNLLVTCREGAQRKLRRALHALVKLRRSRYRNVFLCSVEDPDAFLEAVAELAARRPVLACWLGKILPLDRTFEVEAERFSEQLVAEAAPLVEQIAGKSFHVRVERRGHKGVIHTHDCEIVLGDAVHAALAARGEKPTVDFRDPEIVLAVEVVGELCGLALVTREMRRRCSFVKID